ncbi:MULTISPECIES: hypothetical protein [Nocardia]|uniref:PH domain-containing protein n=1 Tax=Nocardia aurea TaxID=2144174 RepID=A0ABV3FV62_9NOCA|nr:MULTISPECIES: hypothetical protein [Nocardia]
MSSTTYRQAPTAVLDTWLCLAAGILFGGAGTAVVVSALLAYGAENAANLDRFEPEFGLVFGILWCAIGGVGLWAAREIWRTTPRLVITADGLSHWHGGLVTAFAWSEIELIHIAGGRRMTVVARHFDPYRIDTADLSTSADAVADTIRRYRPSAPIVR